MSVLRNIEHKLEGLFEGVFGRAFRTHVQPVELARKLVKEMEDHRVVSVSRVYAPNEYTVYLAPSDREQFASYEESLQSELQEYVAENARRERYELLSPPEVKFETDDDLEMGEFGIATRMVQGAVPQPGEPRAASASRRDDDLPQAGRDRGRLGRGARARPRDRQPDLRRHHARAGRRPRDDRPLARTATSSSPTRTSRASTPRCARRAPRTGRSTSTRPTGWR